MSVLAWAATVAAAIFFFIAVRLCMASSKESRLEEGQPDPAIDFDLFDSELSMECHDWMRSLDRDSPARAH